MRGNLEIHVKYDGEWFFGAITKDVNSNTLAHELDSMVIKMCAEYEKVLKTGKLPSTAKENTPDERGGFTFD